MSSFQVVPYEPEHYVRAHAALGIPLEAWRDVAREAAMHTHGPAFTALVDGEVAATAGVHVGVPGRGECWAIVTGLGRRHPLFVTRHVIRHLRAIIERLELVRVEAVVDAEYWCGRYWVERMGFEMETIRRRYCAGRDFAAYVILPDVPRG